MSDPEPEPDTDGFCPNCGDPVAVDPADRPPLPEHAGRARRRQRALCDACYFERFELIDAPDRLEVPVCATCGAVKRGERWVDVGARDYTDVAVDAVTEALAVHVDARDVAWGVEPEQVDPTTIRMHCTFTGIVRGTPLEASAVVPVKLQRGTCTRCGRIAGDYYAAVVQLRARNRDPTPEERDRAVEIAREYVADREEKGDRNAFITEVDRTADGVDMKISTTQMGQGIATRIQRQFGGSIETSRTLVTTDEDGEEVYRVTYAVRLPPFTPGDVIDPDDGAGPVLVTSVQGNLKGRRLATGERYEATVEAGDAPAAEKLGSRTDAVETTVVAIEDDRAVQVLDPETYEATTVPRPAYMDPEADTVPVLKSRAGLHVLPEA